jgi:hypothetical protein
MGSPQNSKCVSLRLSDSGRAYLQIVESRREGDQIRQQVVATLGVSKICGRAVNLERLLRSGTRFAAKAMMLSAAADDAVTKIAVERARSGHSRGSDEQMFGRK